jgi:hypothetical protein
METNMKGLKELDQKKVKQFRVVSILDYIEITMIDGTIYHAIVIHMDHNSNTIKFLPH